ncbi:MAG: tRNA (adenosine(37)-N6)-threonylcarbamoyltransferase complex ATPase subunit type 1 TsaE [Candidatus Puniceispirillaceae bacterium]
MLDSLALTLSDLAQTKRFANCLSQFIAPGRVFCLSGPLGAGKSELARAMITTFCGPQDDIPSPTFTLVQPYLSDAGFEVWHMDLYRLETAEQVLALGVEEAFFECCCLIEWSDKIKDLLPADQVRIDLAMGPDEDSRVAAVAASPELINIFKQDFFA